MENIKYVLNEENLKVLERKINKYNKFYIF